MIKLFLLNAILSFVAAVTMLIALVPASALAQQTEVSVQAPERVSGAFEVTIDIANVVDMDSGQFDLSYDPDVVEVMNVENGNIGDTPIPIAQWAPLDADTIRVLLNFPGVKGVTGSGHLATICARVTGKIGDRTVLDISSGLLVDKEANKIPAKWHDDELRVETSAPESKPVPDQQADQRSESEVMNDGVSISTPFALGVLATLVVISILYLFIYRRK